MDTRPISVSRGTDVTGLLRHFSYMDTAGDGEMKLSHTLVHLPLKLNLSHTKGFCSGAPKDIISYVTQTLTLT
jgi:hypothetical protein